MSNQTLADAVRNWVHFDNLCSNLSKQMTTARNLRNKFEEQVLSLLGNTKRLRVQGAVLEPATRNNSVTLNWTTLEETLHKYYTDNKKPDETAALLKFLKDNRGQKSTVFLKRTAVDENSAAGVMPAVNSITR
jgi:hypothetical protein